MDEALIQAKMQGIGSAVDRMFNETGPRTMGFCLMVFPLDHSGKVAYISNTKKEDVIRLLEEQLIVFNARTIASPP